MVTVIDMTTGELIHSSNPMSAKAETPAPRQETFSLPSLGLQEVMPEPRRIQMPPALAGHAISEFLAKLD